MKAINLNALQPAINRLAMYGYQLRFNQLLGVVKSVARGIASLLVGQQITHLSFRYSDVMMYVDCLMWEGVGERVLSSDPDTRESQALKSSSDSPKNKVTTSATKGHQLAL